MGKTQAVHKWEECSLAVTLDFCVGKTQINLTLKRSSPSTWFKTTFFMVDRQTTSNALKMQNKLKLIAPSHWFLKIEQ